MRSKHAQTDPTGVLRKRTASVFLTRAVDEGLDGKPGRCDSDSLRMFFVAFVRRIRLAEEHPELPS
jgi:hypothetical protein